jgi:hypothetical protein
MLTQEQQSHVNLLTPGCLGRTAHCCHLTQQGQQLLVLSPQRELGGQSLGQYWYGSH